jgi:hypothetical protein
MICTPSEDHDREIREWMKAKGWEVTRTNWDFRQEIYAWRADVIFPLDSGGHVCRMRGRRVRNEQDARPKLAQIFAHVSAGGIQGLAAEPSRRRD